LSPSFPAILFSGPPVVVLHALTAHHPSIPSPLVVVAPPLSSGTHRCRPSPPLGASLSPPHLSPLHLRSGPCRLSASHWSLISLPIVTVVYVCPLCAVVVATPLRSRPHCIYLSIYRASRLQPSSPLGASPSLPTTPGTIALPICSSCHLSSLRQA
jgi:hypothetical protein